MKATKSVEDLYEAVQASNPKAKINKSAFVKKTKREIEAYVVKQIMGKPEKEKMTFSGEFAEKFSKAEKTAREQAKSMNLSRKDTEVLVQRTLKDEVGKALEDKETEKKIIDQIGVEKVASIATEVANKDKAVQTSGASKYRHSEVVKAIHTAENEQRVDSLIDGTLERIEKTSGVKIDRQKVKENIKQTLEEVMINNATAEPESVKIAFGRDLSDDLESARSMASARAYDQKPLTEKQIEHVREKYSLTEEQTEELRKSGRPADEQYQEMAKQIIHKSLNDGMEDTRVARDARDTYTQTEKRILDNMSPDDLATVITRALNKEGSIERKTYTEEDLHTVLFGDVHTHQSDDQVARFGQVLNQAIELQKMSNEAMLRLNLPTDGVVEQIRRKHSKSKE